MTYCPKVLPSTRDLNSNWQYRSPTRCEFYLFNTSNGKQSTVSLKFLGHVEWEKIAEDSYLIELINKASISKYGCYICAKGFNSNICFEITTQEMILMQLCSYDWVALNSTLALALFFPTKKF